MLLLYVLDLNPLMVSVKHFFCPPEFKFFMPGIALLSKMSGFIDFSVPVALHS